jgi:hypothetical protein
MRARRKWRSKSERKRQGEERRRMGRNGGGSKGTIRAEEGRKNRACRKRQRRLLDGSEPLNGLRDGGEEGRTSPSRLRGRGLAGGQRTRTAEIGRSTEGGQGRNERRFRSRRRRSSCVLVEGRRGSARLLNVEFIGREGGQGEMTHRTPFPFSFSNPSIPLLPSSSPSSSSSYELNVEKSS